MRKSLLFSVFLLTLCFNTFANPDGDNGNTPGGNRDSHPAIGKRCPKNEAISFYYENGNLFIYVGSISEDVTITLTNLFTEEETEFFVNLDEGTAVLSINLEAGEYSIIIEGTQINIQSTIVIE